LHLGWTRPWSAGAESDFDLGLSLVGGTVARTRPVASQRSASTVVGLQHPAYMVHPIFAIIRSLLAALWFVWFGR
jgi:hypothetical protein